MEYLIFLFMLFLNPDGNFDITKDYNSEKFKYETTYDAQGRITFKAKEGATLS